jgi:hypothetical protein
VVETSPLKVTEEKSLAIVKVDTEDTPKKKKEVEHLIAEEKMISGGIRYIDFKNLFSFTIGIGGFILFFIFQSISAFF